MIEQLKKLNERRNEQDRGRVCHAPFNNLFFGNRGFVMSCCFNKLYVLGEYPKQSIKEIWEGEKANQLRLAISKNDFKLGCQNCAALIEEENFDALPAHTYDGVGNNANGFPTRMEFELDNTCNLECIMCNGELSSSIRERREKKPPIISPYDEQFLQQLDEYIPHLRSAQFLGGEPFLIPVYFRIWEKMMALNPAIQMSIQTNGTTLNNRVKKILEALKFSISVSMDGVSREVYEKVRVNGDVERVKQNVRWFSDYCKNKVTGLSISFCPMPQNQNEIPDIVNFANEMGAEIFFNTVFYPAECSLMNLPKEELQQLVQYLDAKQPAANSNLEEINLRKYNDLKNQVHNWTLKDTNFSSTFTEKKFADLDGLLSSLKQMCAEKETPELYNGIEKNLRFLLRKAEEEHISEAAMESILLLNPANLYEVLPSAEPERLYTLFKERIMKIVS